MKLIKADTNHQIKAKLLEITNGSNELLKVYLKLYQDLNDLYNDFPNVYKELERVVTLPSNDDADKMTNFNQELKQELQYLNDDEFLQSVLEGNSLEDNNYNQFPQSLDELPNEETTDDVDFDMDTDEDENVDLDTEETTTTDENENSETEENTEEEDVSSDEDENADFDFDIDGGGVAE